ncbi:MAG: ribulose-phosphate 3-epimerase [Desulfamplus sp.]|nr:ribulose-phosphate 3-epimerase [Desulfamplus sp.]
MGIIAPSILSADFTKLGQELNDVEKAGADWIHIDVMDGHFVPNISYGPIIVDACKKATSLTLDVHLMIEKPDLMIPEFANAGADLISVHAEACTHLHRTIQLIKSLNIKAGVALNPATPLSAIEWVINDVDFVLIMSVNPGFGGQQFIDSSIEKIKALSKMIKEKNSKAIIQIDGGIGFETISKVASAGATSFVAGSAIFKTANYKETITRLRDRI